MVVEHDEETMWEADYIVDLGQVPAKKGRNCRPRNGSELAAHPTSYTGYYLSGQKSIPVPSERRPGNGHWLEIKGAAENNLKNIDVKSR